jgi:hypothetical protein
MAKWYYIHRLLLYIYKKSKIIRREEKLRSLGLVLLFSWIFHQQKKTQSPKEVGCSGKSQHRLLPPSFPPTSSLSTPYSLTSIFHPSCYSFNHLLFLFHKPGQCLPVVSPVKFALFSPYFYAHPPRHHRKTHTYQQSMVERDHLKTTILPPNSNHGIAPQFTVQTTCSRLLVYSLNRCRGRFPAIPPKRYTGRPKGPVTATIVMIGQVIWGLYFLTPMLCHSQTFYMILMETQLGPSLYS